MTKMTKNGVSTTAALGQEQFENFTRKVGRQVKRYVQYDYRLTCRRTVQLCTPYPRCLPRCA